MARYFYHQHELDGGKTTLRGLRIEAGNGEEISREDALVIALALIEERLGEIREAIEDHP